MECSVPVKQSSGGEGRWEAFCLFRPSALLKKQVPGKLYSGKSNTKAIANRLGRDKPQQSSLQGRGGGGGGGGVVSRLPGRIINIRDSGGCGGLGGTLEPYDGGGGQPGLPELAGEPDIIMLCALFPYLEIGVQMAAPPEDCVLNETTHI